MPKRRYLSQDEMELLLSASRRGRAGERNYCLLLMMYIHGCRISEALSITFSDIDFNSGHIYIRRSKHGFSTIQPLLNRESDALFNWLKIRQGYTNSSLSQYIFISQRGRTLSRKQAYNIVKDAGHAAGIPVATYPHMLRHSCGYALADRGMNTRLIQDYLGHKNIRHTVHYTASNAQRFANMWDENK
jgi:integrase